MKSMDPKVWGPHAWALIHAVARRSPSPEHFKAALQAVAACLPCQSCRRHFSALLRSARGRMIMQKTPATAARMLHDEVNRKLNKPVRAGGYRQRAAPPLRFLHYAREAEAPATRYNRLVDVLRSLQMV